MRTVVIASTLLASLALVTHGFGVQNQAKTAAEAKDRPKEITNSLGMKLVWIPPGKFLMGTPKAEIERLVKELDDDSFVREGPQHEVRISKGFYMGVYVVTQEEFEKVMGFHPSYFCADNGGQDKVVGVDTRRFPVEMVIWDEAKEFCKKLSAKEGKTYRLPTEAEWEYACRAGTTTAFHFGDTISSEQANYNGDHVFGPGKVGEYRLRTTIVDKFPANPFGLHDMHGNVMQWCEDWYDKDYYQVSPATDPLNTTPTYFRVMRGGSWTSNPRYCRSAFRFDIDPEDRLYLMGFRVVLVATAE